MELTEDVLCKIKKKKEYNKKYSEWYFGMSQESILNDELRQADIYKRKSEYILDCMNLWSWDVYHKNKVMDLQRVNRCTNNRFCPNCRRLDLAKMIHKFRVPFSNLLESGYLPLLLTLTVPNCSAENLDFTINKLNKDFKKFYQLYSRDETKGFSNRSIVIEGALKVLEITYNSERKTYHPHLHCIVFIQEHFYNEILFNKNIQGHFSYKRSSYNFHSILDVEIMKIWTMINNNIRITVKNFEKYNSNVQELLQCDIKEMDSGGIYEVLKYTFKDSDVKTYNVFKTLVNVLFRKRIRQGYGLLYNFKCEDVDVGEEQDLDSYLEIKENPEHLITHEIDELLTVYKDYRKVSRFNASEELNNLD